MNKNIEQYFLWKPVKSFDDIPFDGMEYYATIEYFGQCFILVGTRLKYEMFGQQSRSFHLRFVKAIMPVFTPKPFKE